jgi:hypothetical protein
MSRARKKIVLDGIEYFIEAVTEAVTPKKKKGGRPKRKRGPKPKPKAVAKKPVAPKKPEEPLSKKDKAEIQRLSGVKLKDLKNKSPSEQREYLKAKSDIEPDPLPNRRKTGPEGFKPVEQGPLLSKVLLPEKMSTAQARRLLMQGKAKVVKDKNGKRKLVSTGEYAPARETIAEEMGLSGKGRLPTEADIKEMGGFEIKKHGGKVEKRFVGGLVRGGQLLYPLVKKGVQKLLSKEGKISTSKKSKKLSDVADRIGNPRAKKIIEGQIKPKKRINPSDVAIPLGIGATYTASKNLNKKKKTGGKVKRNMGGLVRGVGAAERGFGKAKYSDKLY